MESLVCYGELKYIVSFFVVTVKDIDCSGDGEGYMLIILYQYWPGRVVSECVVDGPNHFGIDYYIWEFWSEKIKRVVVRGSGCGSVGLGGLDIVEVSSIFQWYEEGRSQQVVLGMGRIPTCLLYLSSCRLLPKLHWWSITVILPLLRSCLLVVLVPCGGFVIRSYVVSFFVMF